MCLNELIDGYIPRIIRLSLLLIDILQPYVNYRNLPLSGNDLQIEWSVGGTITVDETFILYEYFNVLPDKNFTQQISAEKNPKNAQKILKNMTTLQNGRGIWDEAFTNNDNYKYNFVAPATKGKYLVFVIYAKVDQNWSKQNKPDPQVPPQTHISNIRINDSYNAKNVNFEISGSIYSKSNLVIFDTANLNKSLN